MNEHARLCLEADRAERRATVWRWVSVIFGMAVILGALVFLILIGG